MHWLVTFLIILPLLSAQMHSHLYITELKSRILTFHLIMLKPFSLEELQDTLHIAHDTSAGPNEIHYQLLKHLPNSSQLLLLNIFNKIWISDNFLSDWRKAIVMPVPKDW